MIKVNIFFSIIDTIYEFFGMKPQIWGKKVFLRDIAQKIQNHNCRTERKLLITKLLVIIKLGSNDS